MRQIFLYSLLCPFVLALAFSLASCSEDDFTPKYTINFDSNGGTSIRSVTVKFGQSIVPPAADPALSAFWRNKGYLFVGWYTDENAADDPFDFTRGIYENRTLYARWSKATVNIPDANFRAYLKQNFIDAFPGERFDAEHPSVANNFKIVASGEKIASLQGIELFLGLTELSCSNNSLTALDVSKNVNLTYLNCSSNNLTELDVSKNVSLSDLAIYKNPSLQSLNICGIRDARSLYNDLSGLDGLVELKVYDGIKNSDWVKALKTARGAALTISTYSAAAGSTDYTLVCANYDPNANSGAGACFIAP